MEQLSPRLSVKDTISMSRADRLLKSPETILRERFGLATFRPGQRAVIDALLEHGAALAVFPTGGGKSLCYQLPALLFDGVTVVISPLIALMKDQLDVLQRQRIPAARIDSSLGPAELGEVTRQLREGRLKLLYVAPERFTNERFLDLLGRLPIALFAVDEAHCISEWGHNFRPDYLKLADTARRLGVERVLALTATATPAVVDDICASFSIPRAAAVVASFHRSNLELRTTPTPSNQRGALLLDRLRIRPPGTGIIYVTTQKTAEQVAAMLGSGGIAARAYHAGMDDADRAAVQEWWQAADAAMVVATIAFGMGIDKANVRYVYHYNLPKSLESYSQEIGRAGRDGAPALVELLGSLEDLTQLENFAYGDTPTTAALRGMLGELLGAGTTFDVSVADLAQRHDIRPLVLRTALTYLELRGIFEQGTPFYAGYKAKLLTPLSDILAEFGPERARFIGQVFEAAKAGRAWYAFDPAAIAVALGEQRERVVRMLEYLGDQGWVELQVADARQRYTRRTQAVNLEALTAELVQRFEQREAQEITRAQQVVKLVTSDSCQTYALLRYFGEQHDGACGHCNVCKTGQAAAFPATPPPPGIDQVVDAAAMRALVSEHPEALGQPRPQARFLCGLSSPATTRTKLAKHRLFGSCAQQHFKAVLRWCETAQRL